MNKPQSTEEYIAAFPAEIQKLLNQMRTAIQQAAPNAEEVISYGMPAFKQNGMLVYYAAFSKHIGFYPTSSGIEVFEEELFGYVGGKGSVQFPFDKPLPIDLVKRIVAYRVAENLVKSEKTIRKKSK
ncbi:MAG: iron chaperone [Bacteroidales bacterium]